jgi:hypothetical protein
VAEEPAELERTFLDPPSSGDGLRKVDPDKLPQLQPVEPPVNQKTSTADMAAKSSDAPTTSKDASTVTNKKVSDKAATPAPAGKATPSTKASPAKVIEPVKQVAFRPAAADPGAQLIDSARVPPDQWAAALAERLHDLPANPLENHVVPATLRECLLQVTAPAERRAVIGAFWSAREAAARYQAAVLRGQQIDALGIGHRTTAGMNPSGIHQFGAQRADQLDDTRADFPASRSIASLLYSALRAAAEADQERARVELSEACYHLTVAARQPASGGWLWPGTRPPAERLALDPRPVTTSAGTAPAAQTAAAIARQHLEWIITRSHRLLVERAEAVVKTDTVRAEVALRRNGQDPAAPYLWVQRQHDETLRFLGALTRYHLAYADYTLANTPANAPPETLAKRLLTSEPARR